MEGSVKHGDNEYWTADDILISAIICQKEKIIRIYLRYLQSGKVSWNDIGQAVVTRTNIVPRARTSG